MICLKHRGPVEKSWKLLLLLMFCHKHYVLALSAFFLGYLSNLHKFSCHLCTDDSKPHTSSSDCFREALNHIRQPLDISLDASVYRPLNLMGKLKSLHIYIYLYLTLNKCHFFIINIKNMECFTNLRVMLAQGPC